MCSGFQSSVCLVLFLFIFLNNLSLCCFFLSRCIKEAIARAVKLGQGSSDAHIDVADVSSDGKSFIFLLNIFERLSLGRTALH